MRDTSCESDSAGTQETKPEISNNTINAIHNGTAHVMTENTPNTVSPDHDSSLRKEEHTDGEGEPEEEPLQQSEWNEYEHDTKCGIGPCQPKWLQKLASKKSYILVYGLIGMADFAIGSYFVSTISTIEKRFKIPSRTSGLIASAWDFGGLCSSLLMSYLGSRGHKTRWVACGILLVGLSCFMRLIPHFLFGPGQDALELTEEYGELYGMTYNSSHANDCSVGSFSSVPSTIFIVSFFLMGIGTSMYYTLGISYLDDNVRKNKTPFLLGWGPFGVLTIILSLLFALFPKKLPRAAQRTMAAGNVGGTSARSFADFKLVLSRLAKNKVLLFNSFSSVFFMFGFIGYWTFMPKYMETQFRQSASRSSLITGSIGLICSALGIMTSGIVISKYKPRPRYLAAWNVFVESFDVIGHFSYGFLSCAIDDLHGSMKPDHSWDLAADCNVDCDCGPTVKYSPVCASDVSKTFYSACHAGCTTVDFINGSKIFGNCSCIGNEGYGWATDGACAVDCTTNFTIFLIIQCVMRFFSASGRAGNTIIQFRCVAQEDKSVSIGFTEALLCGLAFIPGPIVYGMLLGFLLGGTLLDIGVWYHVKDLQIYDSENELNIIKKKKDKNKKTGNTLTESPS
ncbi:hypothetical protein C0J52_25495 [Blattella germanica]|nr:hypothetical protein C0J52_25495 [Blattella germanica]